ncbi:hypothetical protein PF672P2_00070 [Parabacteroides phage PF672P2]|nr:hypothetical protein PF672P1_00027 [Parabacteroides phage PF672P1]WAX17207.1 hypothetical protein PF672P2_00070 [Parabacteroides phage PF672P2]
MEVKLCARCGKTLPISEFDNHGTNKDGLQSYCRDCVREYNRERYRKGKLYSNPELAKFTPGQLIEELKARGYTGELKFTQTINL